MPEITAADVLAFLQSAGVKDLAALKKKAEQEKADEAIEKIAAAMRTPETIKADEWLQNLTSLSADFVKTFKSQEKNVQGQGTGKKRETMLTIELADGSFFRLTHWIKKS